MITSKLPNVGTTIFTTMSQLAAETGALTIDHADLTPERSQMLRHQRSGDPRAHDENVA